MTNESKTLFIPLYGKALMSKEGLWQDKTAEKIVAEKEDLFTKADKSKRLAVYMTMRAMQYDSYAENFIKDNPDAIVIHFGCGLDSRISRVTAKANHWYDLDFPDVIALRKSFYSETDSYTMIGSSVTDFLWFDQIQHNNEPVLIIAEGLTMYLTEDDIRTLTELFAKKFGDVTFVFDAYSSFAAKASKIKNPINSVNAKISFSMDDEKLFENKEKGILHKETRYIILDEYISKLRGVYKTRFMFMKKFGSKMYRIYIYTCGKGTDR
ncbi:MAG: class I SAM-dependent methyltransferase [Ruminococcaceae bacterium]|nr:class I SAM-dependent methyltransferase [Oscillospiraceae bacterium]